MLSLLKEDVLRLAGNGLCEIQLPNLLFILKKYPTGKSTSTELTGITGSQKKDMDCRKTLASLDYIWAVLLPFMLVLNFLTCANFLKLMGELAKKHYHEKFHPCTWMLTVLITKAKFNILYTIAVYAKIQRPVDFIRNWNTCSWPYCMGTRAIFLQLIRWPKVFKKSYGSSLSAHETVFVRQWDSVDSVVWLAHNSC